MTNLPEGARFEDATPIMEEVVRAALPAEVPGPRMGSYASDLFILFECPRRYYWDRTAPIRDDRSWFITAEVGNHCHLLIVDLFKRAGLWRGDEVRGGAPAVNLSYRMDLLIADPSAGGLIVPVEIKSAKDTAYHGKVYSGHPEWTKIGYEAAPGFAHYLQLQAYLHFNTATNGERAPYPHGYLCYLSKNDSQFTFTRVYYDPATGEAIEKALLAHEFNVINGLLPAPAGDPADRHGKCYFCPYKSRCAGLIEVKSGE